MFLLRILSRLPLRILYLFSSFLFLMSYNVVRYRTKTVRRNLRRSFPEKSPDELKRIERDFYKNLCDYAVETIKLLTIPKADLAKRVTFLNTSILQQYKEEQKPVIILTSHTFNWEWMLTAGSFSIPFPIDFVYQPVNNSFFERYSLLCRTRFGAYPIKRDEVGRELIKRKNHLRAIAIVADQYPGRGKDKKYMTRFMNQETVFFQGANQIAIITQFPVVYASMKKTNRGFFEVTFEKIGDPPFAKDDVAMIETYIREVEKNIKSNPSSWLWSHNRWKKRHAKKN